MIPTQEAPSSVDIRLENFPEFAGNGTKTPPTDAKRALGYVPSDTFPAENANYLFNKSSRGITQSNMGLLSVEKELNNVLTQAGITTPNINDNTQVYTAIQNLINAVGNLKAPENHASANNTYGVGTSSAFGHLKISDQYTSALQDGTGVAASQKAVADTYAAIVGSQGAPVTNLPPAGLGNLAAAGSSTEAARADHIHPVPYLDRTIICDSAAGAAKEITIADFFYTTGTTIEVFFKHGHYVATASSAATINVNNDGAKSLFMVKDGTVFALPNHYCFKTDAGTTSDHYWVWQENTKLKLMYDASLDDNRGGWLVLDNPVVLSYTSSTQNYLIYSTGLIKQWGIINGNSTKTLLVSYSNTNYNVFASHCSFAAGDVFVEVLTADSFKYDTNYGHTKGNATWLTVGY